jgi:predicted kinase
MLLRCVRDGTQLRYSQAASLSKGALPARPVKRVMTGSARESEDAKNCAPASAVPRRSAQKRPIPKTAKPPSIEFKTTAAGHFPEAVIFIGIQGSGKSTFYRQRFAKTHTYINLDMLRTRAKEDALVRQCLVAKRSFVVDNTNPLASDRAGYIALARAVGLRVKAYFFDTTLQSAIRRNKQRQGKQRIPVPAIVATLRKLQQPAVAEGFDAIYTVNIVDDSAEPAFLVAERIAAEI